MTTLRVEASVLNLRQGPGKEHPVVTRLPKGLIVEQIAESTDGRWLQVRTTLQGETVTGWVSEEFVSTVEEGEAPPPATDIPPWLDKGLHEIGVKEFPGPADNPRIVEYHQRQDRRYAAVAREVSEKHGKPVLTCSELVNTDRHYGNSGPVGVKEEGRLCYPSAHRAIAALEAMCTYAEWRRTQG